MEDNKLRQYRFKERIQGPHRCGPTQPIPGDCHTAQALISSLAFCAARSEGTGKRHGEASIVNLRIAENACDAEAIFRYDQIQPVLGDCHAARALSTLRHFARLAVTERGLGSELWDEVEFF